MPARTVSAPANSNLAHYAAKGYCIVRNAIPVAAIDDLLANYLDLVHQVSGNRFEDAHGTEIVEYFNQRPDVESQIYMKIRETDWLMNFARQESIVEPMKELLGPSIGVFAKIPFRIDMPQWTKELAVWHQDHFYVKGNPEIITAWIPYQDTTYFNGCLSIMPGTHLLGQIEHDVALGKKRVPSTIFNNEVRYVEMRKGDLLLFNALLLHSGNLNLSESIRYSLQPRYTRLSDDVDPGMGEVIAV